MATSKTPYLDEFVAAVAEIQRLRARVQELELPILDEVGEGIFIRGTTAIEVTTYLDGAKKRVRIAIKHGKAI